MNFLADMGISRLVVEELRRNGHGELLAASGGALPSVVIFRLKDMRAANVSKHLSSIIKQQSESLRKGAVLSVTEQKVRIRSLPI